jgi:uncharacterized phiE125 gp8 family phage protein
METLIKLSDIALTASPMTHIMTLQEAKEHCRVDFDDDDAYIGTLIDAAKDVVEEVTRRSLLQTSWRLTTDCFVDGVTLPRSPIIAIDSVQYRDAKGVLTTVDPDEYWLDIDGARLRWVDENLVNRYADALVVEYLAGFAEIPSPLIHAAKLIIGHFYDNREMAYSTKLQSFDNIPVTATNLMERYSERRHASG